MCQVEGRYGSKMAPPRAVEEMVATYQREFGFDFDAFQPSELFERIRGEGPMLPSVPVGPSVEPVAAVASALISWVQIQNVTDKQCRCALYQTLSVVIAPGSG